MKTILRLLIIVLCFFVVSSAIAQDEPGLFPSGQEMYDRTVPTPFDIMGHRLGERLTFHSEMENFINAVAESSNRIRVESYGKTYQGRSLYTVIISSPANLTRLEDIKKANKLLTDPRVTSQKEAKDIAEWMPSIVWLGYNIHGNEVSGGEAAIRTIYQLAAGTDEITSEILKNVVVVIDPLQNPDGRDRFVHYQRSVNTLRSHPQSDDAEHSNPWPGGRTNHYLFDLNRDFFLKTQIESVQKTKVYHEWMPHVFADLHEMGTNSSYYFAPPMDPYNEWTTSHHFKWWNIFGEENAAAFNEFSWAYFTKESFDSFYPGYGISYPSINGSIGMTYEQASSRGLSSFRDDGTILTLREASHHHFIASMATVKASSDRREEQVLDFYGHFAEAMLAAKKEPVQEIILNPVNDPRVTAQLVENMLIEGVEVKKAIEPFTVRRANSYYSSEVVSKDFPAGTFIIDINQPQMRLIKALLYPESPLSDEFIKGERERLENRERSHFYDVTAWSMPLTYGIDAYWTSENLDISIENITAPPVFSGYVNGGKATHAYAIPYNSLDGTRMLVRLTAENYKVRIARKPFTVSGKSFPTGTLIVLVHRNPESLHARISELAQENGVEVTALNTGLSSVGIDIGSNDMVSVKKSEVAIVTNTPTASYSFGAMHYLFERKIDLPFTRISVNKLANLGEKYNVVVLPSGNFSSSLSVEQLKGFTDWIKSGGTVVSVAGSSRWLRQAKISKTTLLNGTDDPETGEKIEPWRTPGSIIKVRINPLSFLSYGVQPFVAAFVRSSEIYAPFNDRFKDIGLYSTDGKTKLSGWLWPETEKYLAGSGYLFVEPVGRGKLVLFTEDPNFRASYEGLNKLFFNGIVLGPSFR